MSKSQRINLTLPAASMHALNSFGQVGNHSGNSGNASRVVAAGLAVMLALISNDTNSIILAAQQVAELCGIGQGEHIASRARLLARQMLVEIAAAPGIEADSGE